MFVFFLFWNIRLLKLRISQIQLPDCAEQHWFYAYRISHDCHIGPAEDGNLKICSIVSNFTKVYRLIPRVCFYLSITVLQSCQLTNLLDTTETFYIMTVLRPKIIILFLQLKNTRIEIDHNISPSSWPIVVINVEPMVLKKS
jgi:hypothetical protein